MGTSVQFTPLLGAFSEDPLCYLLQIDDFRILLDCGWNDLLDPSLLAPLQAVAPSIDAVLLSHSDMLHIGALPYAYAKLGLKARVYCTHPVFKMGVMCLYDAYLARRSVSNFDLFTMDDVDGAFEGSVQLKFSQPQVLTGKGRGITITPYAAGHLLGGAIWKITKDTEDLIYAVDYNHRVERHLNGTVLETFVRPSVLIADAANALGGEVKRKQRDAELIDVVMATLNRGGHVLMPVETSGRILEIALHLEQHWEANDVQFNIAFLTNESFSTMEFARGMLEWLSDGLSKAFEQSRNNPYNFKHVKLVNNRKDVDDMAGAKVVMATTASLEAGFSRQLFAEWAANPSNTLLFTTKSTAPAGSLAHTLLSQDLDKVQPGFSMVSLMMTSRIPLEGEELVAFEEEMRKRTEEEERSRGDSSSGLSLAIEGEGVETGVEREEEGEGVSAGGMEGVGSRGRKRKVEEEGEEEGMEEKETMEEAEEERKELLGACAGDDVVKDGRAPLFVEGFTPSPSPHPLFPCPEPSLQSDEFGEVVDPDAIVASAAPLDAWGGQREGLGPLQQQLLHGGRLGGGDTTDEFGGGETTDLLAKLEAPAKVLTQQVTVTIRCSIRFVDFEGRSDGRSLKTILSHVAPLKLILVHGSPEATLHLQQHCTANVCPLTIAPRIGQTVDLTSDLRTYKFRLSDELMAGISMKQLGEDEVAWIDARIRDVGSESDGLNLKTLVPQTKANTAKRRSVFVGDVKLSDFKVLLSQHEIEAEFVEGGGTLKCGPKVKVRKTSGHQLVIQGPLSSDYFKIRKLLYSQFYIV